MSKKQSTWSEGDERVLLELWAERANDLRCAKRNLHIYLEISVEMAGKFSAQEVHIKIKHLIRKYREEKKKIDSSGCSPSMWKHFGTVHQIIGGTAINNAHVWESFSLDSTTASATSTSTLQNSQAPQPQPSPEPLPSPTASQPFASPSLSSPNTCPLSSPNTSPLSSPNTSPLSSPNTSPLSSPNTSPLSSPLASTSTSVIAASSSGRKRKADHLGDMVKLMKEQSQILKSVAEDNKMLSSQILEVIRQHNTTQAEFVDIMKTLINKF